MSERRLTQSSRDVWADRRVLVTGAGGFIGSQLTEALVARGARVRAFVHYRGNGSYGWLDQSPVREDIEVMAGDIRDRDLILEAMREIQVVFHLAALIGIPYSYHAPASYLETNVLGTSSILQAARACGVERLVHTSTSEVYGSAQYVPINEQHPLQAQSPYAASKIGADKLAESFHRSFGLPLVIVRPFNTFGPRQSTRAVVPTIITQCLTQGRLQLGNLHPTRDLNYVSNIVDGFLLAAERPEAIGHTINLGSGREISIQSLAQLIGTLTDTPLIVEQDAQRVRPATSEVDRLIADPTMANTLLEWQPSVSLEEGMARTIAWMREHLDGYRPSLYAV